MGSHILFLVHGIGKHATEWAEAADGPVDALKGASRQYAFFDTTDLESRVDLVPVHYDEVFSQVVDAWKQNASAVNELRPGVGFTVHYGKVVNVGLLWRDVDRDGSFDGTPYVRTGIRSLPARPKTAAGLGDRTYRGRHQTRERAPSGAVETLCI